MSVVPTEVRTPAPRRVVVKIGSAVVVSSGRLDRTTIDRLAADVAALVRAGHEVIVVSSGAVAGGLAALGLEAMPARILDKQAAAAIGQQRLMRAWSDALADAAGLHAAQVLLTADDLEHRQRFLNARHTLERLLKAGVVPIVNENDSVSFDEIKLGDNDRLGALVAVALDADLLVILSSVPGVLDADDRPIPLLTDLDAAKGYIRPDRSGTGVGGMTTKLEAVDIATSSGVECVIAAGARVRAIVQAVEGAHIGTRIPARATGPAARKRWLAHTVRPRGAILVDAGARDALCTRGASLLPKGVIGVEGDFAMGALVEVRGPDGAPFARGLASYAAHDVARIAGKRATEIESVLGYAYADAVIHRDDLALLRAVPTPGSTP